MSSTTTPNIAYQILLDALGAMRNGFVYGCKIRAPHTFVLQMVWSKGTWQSVFQRIYDLTSQHATNLALNAVFFKLGVALLKLAQGTKDAQAWHHAVMGGICGFLVWGKNNSVNWQVNMYMMSRALSGLLLLALEKRKAIADAPGSSSPLTSTEKALFYSTGNNASSNNSSVLGKIFRTDNLGPRLCSAAIWGTALYIFFHHSHVLHGSLRASMDYIYRQGDEHEGSLERVVMGKPDPVNKPSNDQNGSGSEVKK